MAQIDLTGQRLDLRIVAGASLGPMELSFVGADDQPVDLTGVVPRARFSALRGGDPKAAFVFDLTQAGAGVISMTLPAAQTGHLPRGSALVKAVLSWELALTFPDGTVQQALFGEVRVEGKAP